MDSRGTSRKSWGDLLKNGHAYAEHGLGVLNVWAASSLTARLILCLKPFPDVPGSSFAIGRRGGTPFWMYLCLTSGSDLGCDSRGG